MSPEDPKDPSRRGPRRERSFGGVRAARRRTALCAFLLLVFAPPLSAQSVGRVLGVAVDRETGRPVDGAIVTLRAAPPLMVEGGDTVEVRDAVGPAWELQALTDAQGRFAITDVPPGRAILDLQHVAYGPAVARLRVVPGSTVDVQAGLVPVAIELEPLFATVVRDRKLEMKGFYDRREWGSKSGRGHYFTREDIEQRSALRISHLMKEIPATRTECSGARCSIVLRRGCSPSFYVDGIRWRLGPGEFMDDFIMPGNIAGLEVYEGASQLPAEFVDERSLQCGAVVVWSG